MNEMRKLIETIEQINEDHDPTAGGRMRDVYSDISKLKAKVEQIHWDFEKYPNLDQYREIADKINAELSLLQRLFRDVEI